MIQSSNRITYLDQIRGSMILWMLVWHVSLNYGYIQSGSPVTEVSVFSLMSFFMTPFYFYSGYLFSPKRSISEFTVNKIRKLLIPYMFFTLWGIVIYELYSLNIMHVLDFSFVSSFIPTAAFKTNTPCWFFVSLFLVCEFYYILNCFANKMGGKFVRIAIVISFLLAYVTKNHSQYFGYGNVLLGITYFHMGYELKLHEGFVRKHCWQMIIVSLFLYSVIGFLFPTSLSFVLNLLRGGNYVLNLIFSLSACLLLWFVAPQIGHTQFGKSLAYIGRISLVVFASHRPVLNWVVEPIVMRYYPTISYPVFLLICLVILLILSVILERLLNAYVPKLIGK